MKREIYITNSANVSISYMSDGKMLTIAIMPDNADGAEIHLNFEELDVLLEDLNDLKNQMAINKVTMICENCSEGEMVFDGNILLSYPPLYPHTCNHCGDRKNLYPTIIYE